MMVKKITVLVIISAIITVTVLVLARNRENKLQPSLEKKGEVATNVMKIRSSAFENNAKIPAKYTCDGENINPPLSFLDVPQNAKSLVLISDDPDAPAGTWVHWLVFNIGPKATGASENSTFKGAKEGITSFGRAGYGGPCPPSGTHRYFFKLYALDTVLDFTNPNKETLEKAMDGHILEKAELIGLYSRI